MRDVIEQLDSYQSHLDAVYPAVTVEEVFGERLVEPESLGAPSQRTWRPVAAFAAAFVAVVAVGVSVYLLGSTDTVVTDSTPLVVTTAVETPAVPVSSGDLAEWRWEQVAVGSLWADSVLDLAAFDNGGFMALTDADGAVYWSPDGTEWINADPNRVLSPYQDRTVPGQVERQLVTTVGNQAVILGSADAEPFGLWVGDPRNGEWRFLPLDTNGISEGVRALAVTTGDVVPGRVV